MNKYRTKKELELLIKSLEPNDIIEFDNVCGKCLAEFNKDKTLVLKTGDKIPQTHILNFMEYVARDYNNGKPRYILYKKTISM